MNNIAHRIENKLTFLVLVCFFLSGVTGLVYEILWTRMIVKIIGTAPFAISIVLTVFMGGLGLGSLLAAKTIDRVKSFAALVHIYGLLELVVGLYALILPFLIKASIPFYSILYNHLFNYFLFYNFLTFVGCSLLLVLPVICMGATLPILCRFYVTNTSHLGKRAGYLYGLNSIGAAVGSLLCGFFLLNLLGIWGTLVLAVAVNCGIGLICIIISRYITQEPSKKPFVAMPPDLSQVSIAEYPGQVTAALIIFAVSGFCAMAYEVIWTRLLALLVGPTTYSFTIVLVSFILGLALGSIFFGYVADKTSKVIWLLIFTQVLAAIFALAVSQVLGNSQFFFAKLIFTFKNNFALLNIMKAAVLFAFLILPTFLLGATFPLVGKIFTQTISTIGRSIGLAYTINTFGAVAGSLVAGFILIPLLGKEKSISLLAAVQIFNAALLATILMLRKRQGLTIWAFVSVISLMVLVFCKDFPVWNRYVLAKGWYFRFETIQSAIKKTGWLKSFFIGPEVLSKFYDFKVVYYGDGVGGFTTVLEYKGSYDFHSYSLVNSGKPDASSSNDMSTQTLSAHFPMLFHHNARDVMVLGLASGITAGEVLNYPVNRLDIVEISKQVAAASDFFKPWNNNVLADKRTSLIIQDGRAHLQLTNRTYDVIISEPSNPWMAGLGSLFTKDFFEIVRDRLNTDGIFAQWFHSYEMDWSTFATVGRAFAQTFPNSVLLTTNVNMASGDFLLLGFKGTDQFILPNAQRNLNFAQKSRNHILLDPRLLYRLILTDDLGSLFGSGTVNSDNNPCLEFAAPRQMYAKNSSVLNAIKSQKSVRPQYNSIIHQIFSDPNLQCDFAAYAFSVHCPSKDYFDLPKLTSQQRQRLHSLIVQAVEKDPLIAANSALYYSTLAETCLKFKMFEESKSYYFKLQQIDPQNAQIHTNLGYIFNRLGDFEQAVHYFQLALKIKPDFVAALYNFANACSDHGDLDLAFSLYNKAIAFEPDNADIFNGRGVIFVYKNNYDDAIKDFRHAIELSPAHKEAQANLAKALSHKENRSNLAQ